jgi:hypothetical protein
MSIIAKPHGDFAPNTTAESAKVNDQLNLIYSDHNGGLLDANISAAANIQQAKIHNLTSDLAATNANVNTLFNNFNITVATVANDVGEPSSAFVGEAQLYTPIFVAANALSTGRYLFVSQDFLMNIVTGSNCQLKYYYGGVLFFAPLITNASGVTQNLMSIHVDLTLKARNSAVAQFGIGRCFLQTTDDAFYAGSTGRGQFLNATGIAVDSTADQSIQTNAVWDVPGNLIVGVGCSSWIVK